MKNSIVVLTLAVLSAQVALAGSPQETVLAPATSTQSEQIPGTFDRFEYQMEQRHLNDWLVSEQASKAAERAIVVNLTDEERDRISGECTDCTGRLLVGVVKPVGRPAARRAFSCSTDGGSQLPGLGGDQVEPELGGPLLEPGETSQSLLDLAVLQLDPGQAKLGLENERKVPNLLGACEAVQQVPVGSHVTTGA
jgi:hypothetical protein